MIMGFMFLPLGQNSGFFVHIKTRLKRDCHNNRHCANVFQFTQKNTDEMWFEIRIEMIDSSEKFFYPSFK